MGGGGTVKSGGLENLVDVSTTASFAFKFGDSDDAIDMATATLDQLS